MRDAEKTRGRILAAAGKAVVDGDVAGLTVNGLSEAAGCGKPLIYRYFGGLDGVLGALADRELSWARDRSGELAAGKKGEGERILAALRVLSARPVAMALAAASLAPEKEGHTRPLAGFAERLVEALLSGKSASGAGSRRDQARAAMLLGAGLFFLLARRGTKAWQGFDLTRANDLGLLEHALMDFCATMERDAP